MSYAEENDKKRKYYSQDFSEVNKLLLRIRAALVGGQEVSVEDLDLKGKIDYKGSGEYFYITLFQEFQKQIRFGGGKKTLQESVNRAIKGIREHKRFGDFNVSDPNKTRIMIEWVHTRRKVDIRLVHLDKAFDENRFEPGITGIEAYYNNKSYIWLPTDTPVMNEMTLSPALINLAERIGLVKPGMKRAEKIKLIKNLKGAEFYLLESAAFVSFENEIVPLYRGNVLYKDFDYETLLTMFKTGNEWLKRHLGPDGRFTYYYNPTLDNNIDHEHPSRRPPNLYYNDLRHAGAAISLLRMYELTKDESLLEYVRRAINWTIGITRFHKDKEGNEAAYVYTNLKAKLGGVGLPLIMLMRYRTDTNDKTYDRYIEGYARHLISRMTPEGEFMGYYIHPEYHNGEPLEEMTDEERKKMFSFYYPGEALLGLGMVANRYDGPSEFINYVKEKSKIAMRWIIDERPKLYAEHFTALPSDAWLMQAIEEWANCEGFLEKADIDFVFNDAKTMMERSYKKDDSPYIDFEGGMYYNHGDHYYPDGARCEGLIAAYYLAKHLKKDEFAKDILSAAKKAAKCQFQLYNSKYNNFAHRNPSESLGSIKFKATRQWVRIDSIQHVVCFFIRLYWAEHKGLDQNVTGGKYD